MCSFGRKICLVRIVLLIQPGGFVASAVNFGGEYAEKKRGLFGSRPSVSGEIRERTAGICLGSYQNSLRVNKISLVNSRKLRSTGDLINRNEIPVVAISFPI